MNLLLPFSINTLWSYKKELFYVAIAFLITLLLPIVAVVVISNAGIKVVSDRLVSLNIQTHLVEIHDPATGKVILSINDGIVWPLHGVITLEFGESDLPYQPLHTGIDIATKMGDPIRPFMKGKVILTDELTWGYGKYVIIDNGNNVTSLYGHLSKINVKKDDEVTPDDVIGFEGRTGWATGPHLHFETRVFGIPVNPRVFLNN